MNKILVAYTTNAGSTTEVVEAVAKELGKNGATVEVRRLEEVSDVGSYQAIVVAAPMILGWHSSAANFVIKHQQALSRVPVAYLMMCMSLTTTGKPYPKGISVTLDPDVAKEPKSRTGLSLTERFTTLEHYLDPVLRAVPQVKPVSVGIFGGKLDYYRLNWLQRLFVMIIIQARPGDRRNWPVIQQWAAGLRDCF